ncbi:MAG: efflux RND transporter periplasmic adaptor subunit [Kiritimatiellae bacterium]|nr:efflux RND transporter periplasmic adaptor subunit [Kiritimatiellia bacterium]
MKKKIVIFVVMFFVVVIVLAVSIWLMKPEIEKIDDEAQYQEKRFNVSVVELQKQNIEDIVSVIGIMAPFMTVSESVEQSGTIDDVYFKKGDYVKEGDVLLSIDNDAYRFRREQEKARYDKAKSDNERWEKLKTTGSVSEYVLEEKKTDMLAAKWDYELANLALEQCEVKASISGYVQDRFVDKGEYVSPGMTIAEIKDLEFLKLEVNVPEKDIFFVKVGDELAFTVDALGEKKFKGVVAFVAPEADRKSNTFLVELNYDNFKNLLKPGIIVRLKLKRKDFVGVLVVPLSSLVVEKGRYIAYTVKDGETVRNVVRLVQIIDSQAVVSSGLEVGDKLIVKGQRSVLDGTKVEIFKETECDKIR